MHVVCVQQGLLLQLGVNCEHSSQLSIARMTDRRHILILGVLFCKTFPEVNFNAVKGHPLMADLS